MCETSEKQLCRLKDPKQIRGYTFITDRVFTMTALLEYIAMTALLEYL